MEFDIKSRLNEYIELYDEIAEKTDCADAAIAVMHELSKDRRASDMRYEKRAKSSDAATSKQKELMKELNIDFDEGITKKQASKLITEELSKNE